MSGQPTFAGQPLGPLHGPSPGLRIGRDARYELLTKLGEGGMGSVWKARDAQLGRDVAIKRILGQATPVLRERFQRETQAVTGLRHPNIVTVFDAGEDAFGLYLVMEFVPGHTLDVLLRKGALPAEQAVATMVGLCRGAAHAHKKGVVHRDIKPGNVMLDDDGTPRLLDFGLVRMDGASELSMTGVGMGTLDYAAPEQKRDASKADARSDVYALGLVFYEILTGLRPPVTLKRAPEVWRGLIEKATDSVATDRHANAEDLLAEVEATQSQAASDTYASQLLGKEDDLRCPECKLLNTLEAKFCRACSTSLRAECPACSRPVRVGLKRCDQCTAEVSVVAQLRAGLDALRREIETGQLAEASHRIESLRPFADRKRLGAAEALVAEMDAQIAAFATACEAAEAEAAAAEEALQREDVAGASEAWRKALATDQRMVAGEADWQGRLAVVQERIAKREAELLGSFQAIDVDLQAGRLTRAEQALAVATRELNDSGRAWQSRWSQRARETSAAIAEQQRVANVTQLRAGLDILRREIASGQLAEASNRIEVLRPLADRKRLGAAEALVAEMNAQIAAFATASEAAAAEAAAAEEALQCEDVARAIEARRKALATDQRMVAGEADWQGRLAVVQERIAKAEDDLLRSFHAIEADLQAGRLTQAEQALAIATRDLDIGQAKLSCGYDQYVMGITVAVTEFDADQRAWHSTWCRRARAVSADIASRRTRAAGHASTAEAAMGRCEYEQAHSSLLEAALLDGEYVARAEAFGVAIDERIAERDTARAAWSAVAERLQQAAARGDHRAARAAADQLEDREEALGRSWLYDRRLQLAASMAELRRLENVAETRRHRKEMRMIGVVGTLAIAIVLLVLAAYEARLESQRREDAVDGEQRRVAADTAAIEAATAVIMQGKMLEFASLRALQARLPGDPRVDLLMQRADIAANEWLMRCEESLGPRLKNGDEAAYAEWQALAAWFGEDTRLKLLRAAALGSPEQRLRRAGLTAALGSLRDDATGMPRKVVHTASGAELVLIARGDFMMGSVAGEPGWHGDELQHPRVIRWPFYLGVTEVTQAQWRRVMGSNPSRFRGDDLPVEQVSWEDCQQFLQKAGGGLRLPSEAEWEYACRAGTTTPFSFGATITPEQVNYDGNYPYGGISHGLYREGTVAAGSLPANAWGLHEMHGNVWEWCQDGYDAYPGSGTDEPSLAAGARVVRGGCWNSGARNCRSASRVSDSAACQSNFVGFRLARTLPE